MAGPIIRNMGNIFIDRSNRRDIPRAGAEVIRKLNEQEGVIVFPEGTSTKGEDVLPVQLVISGVCCQDRPSGFLRLNSLRYTARRPDTERTGLLVGRYQLS